MGNQYLIKARLSKLWTEDEASEAAGVTTKTYRRWEAGDRVPNMTTLRGLCQGFGETPKKPEKPENLGYIVERNCIRLRPPEGAHLATLFNPTTDKLGFMDTGEEEQNTSSELAHLPANSSTQTTVVRIDKAVIVSITTHPSQIQIAVRAVQNEPQSHIPQTGDAISSYVVDTSPRKEKTSSSPDVHVEGTMDKDPGLEGEDSMEKLRREMLLLLQKLGLVAATTGIPAIGQQDLITEVQCALRQPSLGPGDKELKDLEHKIRGYWLDYYNVTIPPADLILHVDAYVREMTTLLKRSLLPSIRTRLCACLSQGVLLVGVNCYGLGQFQRARAYLQIAIDSAREASNNILQASAYHWDSYTWMRSNEVGWNEHALDSMLKASYFASLESDLTVQCWTEAGLSEVYALCDEEEACLKALKRAGRLNEHVLGDSYYIHRFDRAHLNGYRGVCLQQLYRPDDPETYPLLKEAKQVLQEALSQLNVVVLERAFLVVDLAQLHAREGQVESTCGYAKQIIGIASASVSLRQRLWTVRTLLEPYADVEAVKELDGQIRALLLVG
jgi:transcriptional regulator with XRE-family HTH domain